MNNTSQQKDTWSPAIIDLHLHIDGSVPLLTAQYIAALQGISIPSSLSELKHSMSALVECKDLNDYLDRFILPCSLLHIRQALTICTADLLTLLHCQGLRYAELRFAPQKSCMKGLSQYEATEAVLQAMQQSPLPCGLIVSMMRGDDNQKENLETIEVAKALKERGVVAVDLAGAEALYPTSLFHDEFKRVRASGLPLIVHAGEAAGADSVKEAVRAGARRIGHGVRALEDKEAVKMLVENQVTLELCPTSNLNTAIFSRYEDYPLRPLMEAGVPVSINTDNMTVSDTTLRNEWDLLINALHLTRCEQQLIVSNTIDACFCSEELKNRLKTEELS